MVLPKSKNAVGLGNALMNGMTYEYSRRNIHQLIQ